MAVARALALFLGLFTFLNVTGDLVHPHFDANLWWIDLRPLPARPTDSSLGATGGLLLAWALFPAAGLFLAVSARTGLSGAAAGARSPNKK